MIAALQVLGLLSVFILLSGTSTVGLRDECTEHDCYYASHARLVRSQPSSSIDCSDPTSASCSRQERIDEYFFEVKILLTEYSAIILATVKVACRSVRWSPYMVILALLTSVFFGTDFVFYVNDIVRRSSRISFTFMVTFPQVMVTISMFGDDPLFFLLEYQDLSANFLESLVHHQSRRARFYCWTRKIKKRWNIKQDCLIISVAVALILSVPATIAFPRF